MEFWNSLKFFFFLEPVKLAGLLFVCLETALRHLFSFSCGTNGTPTYSLLLSIINGKS